MNQSNENSMFVFLGWISIWVLVSIGVTLSTLHILNQIYPSANVFPEFVKTYLYGPEFFSHVLELWVYPIQLWLHIILGIGYLLISPLQFMPSLRKNFPSLHRTIGWSSVVMGVVLSLGGMILVVNAGYVGVAEQIIIFFVALFYMVMVYMALKNIRRGHIARHREFMILAFAMMLAVIEVRPWYVMLLNAGYPSREIFVPSMWLATVVNMTIASAWILYTRRYRSPDKLAINNK
jgi:uncharacterized membrane protein